MSVLCVASQTPLIQFENTFLKTIEDETKPLDLSQLMLGVDYKFSPGGVSRMLYPLLRHMIEKGMIERAEWICLNPKAPQNATIGKVNLHHISALTEKLKGYGSVKEKIWRLFHGLKNPREPLDLWQDDYVDFTFLNRKFSELASTLHEQLDFDAFYIHDFQLLPMGYMLDAAEPKIFRWHIPLREQEIASDWRGVLLRYLSSYDAVIVSTRSYLETLKRLGYDGPAYQLYPYIDPSEYQHPSPEEVHILRQRLGLSKEDKVILTVARLDPMKAQDKVIFALKEVLSRFPNARLVLVGNGSFSSSRSGIGLPKAERWLLYLKKCISELRLEKNVIFAGYLKEDELRAIYATSEVFVLPSIKEGFGLVVVEAWLYKKPTLVSSEAGIADLIKEGENGFTFNPRNTKELASKIIEVLQNRDGLADRMGKEGFETSRLCHIDVGMKKEVEILAKYIGGIAYPTV
jgi:glycosyltransferase involved in cell wall biosynthesis